MSARDALMAAHEFDADPFLGTWRLLHETGIPGAGVCVCACMCRRRVWR
jgi:hypothetical protein